MIESIEWGKIQLEDGSVYKDAKLWPGGSRDWDWKETGTRHRPGIQVSDIEELLDNGSDYIVLSRGYECMLMTTDLAEAYLQERSIPYEILETGKAAERYNTLLLDGVKVGALIHSTC